MDAPQPLTPIRISAPGKVILHGEHSVVYGKLALAASLGLRTRLEFSEDDSRNVATFNFSSLNLLQDYNIQDLQNLIDRPLPFVESGSAFDHAHPELLDHATILDTVKTFIRDKSNLDSKQQLALTSFLSLFWSFLGPSKIKLIPFTVKISSDLTVSAGTGSSASFAVTISAFLLQYIKLKPQSIFKLTNQNLSSFDKDELELVSKWAFQSERIIHGTPSGVDNTICTYGGLVEFRKGAEPKLVRLSTRFTLLLINTNIPRDTKRLVEGVAARKDKYQVLVEGILNSMEEVAKQALDFVKKIDAGVGDEPIYESLGELADINQNLLGCLGVSHPKLDEICLVLKEEGLRGKLTGAGGGGYAICLVPPSFSEEVVGRVMEELKGRDFGVVLTDLGGCGVSIDS